MKKNFKDFGYYLVRWLLFGGIVGLLQFTYGNPENYWVIKAYQVAYGLAYGFICALVFTAIQNKLNSNRLRGKTWAIVLAILIFSRVLFGYVRGIL